jgi:hypothetical protein
VEGDMVEFLLFRAKVLRQPQVDLFLPETTPSELLEAAIDEKPSRELRNGVTWHLGNVERVDDTGVAFRFGKTITATREIFQDGNFESTSLEESPSTLIFAETALEILAIAAKKTVGGTPFAIANRDRVSDPLSMQAIALSEHGTEPTTIGVRDERHDQCSPIVDISAESIRDGFQDDGLRRIRS